MSIGFIGGGIMAEAIIRGVLNQKNISSSDFLISELVESRRNFLKDTYKINVTSNNTELIEKSDVKLSPVKSPVKSPGKSPVIIRCKKS